MNDYEYGLIMLDIMSQEDEFWARMEDYDNYDDYEYERECRQQCDADNTDCEEQDHPSKEEV